MARLLQPNPNGSLVNRLIAPNVAVSSPRFHHVRTLWSVIFTKTWECWTFLSWPSLRTICNKLQYSPCSTLEHYVWLKRLFFIVELLLHIKVRLRNFSGCIPTKDSCYPIELTAFKYILYVVYLCCGLNLVGQIHSTSVFSEHGSMPTQSGLAV